MTSATVYALLPELLLVLVATGIYLGGAFAPGRHWGRISVFALLVAAVALVLQYNAAFHAEGKLLDSVNVGGPVVLDLFGLYVRLLAIVVGALFVLTAAKPNALTPSAEFSGTLLMAVAGTMLVASAQEMVLLFLGLELVSIPTYVLLYLGRNGNASAEATVKYFFLSILSSAVLLYGFTFLYGLSGETHLALIRGALAEQHVATGSGHSLGRVALGLILAGLGFRITAVPFHFYAPDVYHGTTNANVGLLSVLPKLVGFVALVRVIAFAMPGFEPLAWRVVLVLAVLTMTLGNTLALWQDNIRRMLAYSSIAHGGYLMIGLTVGLATLAGANVSPGFEGLGALLFYLSVYSLATAGTFAALTYLGSPDKQVDTLDELAGAGQSHPWVAGALAVFMFSLAGIPPLAGFWGKLALFFSALGTKTATASEQNWFYALAVIGALNAAIAAAYYLRIVGVMYFRNSSTPLAGEGGRGAWVATLAAALLVIYVGVNPGVLQTGAAKAGTSLATSASESGIEVQVIKLSRTTNGSP